MEDLLRLDGRIVVVSGAGGGGIGTTVTAMVARAGATVIAVSRSKENLDEHIAPLAQQGLPVLARRGRRVDRRGHRRGASTKRGVPTAACTAWSMSPVAPRRRRGCRRPG